MIESFIHEIDKQISSNRELYNQTKYKIFYEQLQKLESLKTEILKNIQNFQHTSVSTTSFSINR